MLEINDTEIKLKIYILCTRIYLRFLNEICFIYCFYFHFLDDTYMYDDAVRGPMRPHQIGHWYDEPPYESDPDDFLMSGINAGPAAIIQV